MNSIIFEKIIGINLMYFSFKLFKLGINSRDEGNDYITNIRSIGAAILMFVIGLVLIFSSEKIF